ncbi:MAG: protein kinase [Gemmatimonadaceae bacterium]|nr:protein kinase [Gemmatimonadaceae bacterium]
MKSLPESFAAALESRYAISRELGAGGMATVFLAEDHRHHRQVAIKVLRPELAEALGAERFLQEITTTANLRHPHILPLFDSGEAGGSLFYVMPFVEGETLRDRLTRVGALPTDEALRIADEVADALHYAHSRGVVHRDIKPENILLENGHAVVADFGIAQAVRQQGGEKLTEVGLSLGTPHYMSPEQGAGDEVDARTDLYALGCVTYEMLAGAPPFEAPTPMAVLVKHAVQPVPSLAASRTDLPDTLVEAIARAMAKKAEDRYGSLLEWRAAIKPALVFGSSGATPRVAAIDKAPPAFATALLGRESQLQDAAAQLAAGARVLSITGYGGTGKTRFASALQRRVAAEYPGGSAFVSLASVTDPAEVLPTVTTALDLNEAHGRSALDALASLVGERRVLLLLDNLEQVVEAAEDIAALVARCPSLQVVTTSRRPLRISAEVELALPPLELPSAGAALEETLACPAVALFVQRAEKVRPGFVLSAENAAAVSGICRSLDGLPLALELAAARTRILEPAALLQRLDHALDLLTSGDRDLPQRQRTLRATISWSYSLLTPEEQLLLQRLSVFQEGWSLDAMEAVCYEPGDRWRALDELASLVEKGLVRVTDGGERYGLLETIRAFAAEQLHTRGEVEAVRDAHARHFVDVAMRVAAGIQGTTQTDAMRLGKRENANLFAAIGWLLSRAKSGHADAVEQGMLLCGSLTFYIHIVGLHLVVLDAVETLLALAKDRPPTLGRALANFAAGMVLASTGELDRSIAYWMTMSTEGLAVGDFAVGGFGRTGGGYAMLGLGRIAEAGEQLASALPLVEKSGNEFVYGVTLTLGGLHRFLSGDLPGGKAQVERAHEIQRRIGDNEGGGMSLSFLAQMHFASGDVPRAMERYREAEVAFETVGDKPELARVQGEQGYLALAAGDIAAARKLFLRALRSADEIGSAPATGQALLGLAATESAAGRRDIAVTLGAAAQALVERAGVVIEHGMAPGLAAKIEALKASVPREALEGLTQQGRTLSLSAVAALVAG